MPKKVTSPLNAYLLACNRLTLIKIASPGWPREVLQVYLFLTLVLLIVEPGVLSKVSYKRRHERYRKSR